MAKLRLATCQFRIEKQPARNLVQIKRQMRNAVRRGAHLVHFSEACLTGYLGSELKSVRETDWDQIREHLQEVRELAAELGVHVVLGSNHRLSGNHKPHNSLYVIDNQGRLKTRYDKLFCTGCDDDDGDLKHYSPGSELITFIVKQVKCGLLICHDYRYPELFREYKRRGVQLMLVSFHNAGMTAKQYRHYLMSVPVTLQAAAASNYYWVGCNNGTRKYAWPSFVLNPEGWIVNKARAHRDGVIVTDINTDVKLYDASAAWRDRCLRGVFHSGRSVADKRSRNRSSV